MAPRDLAFPAACIAIGFPWILAACWRAPGGTALAVARSSLGGGLAAALALGAFGLLERAGIMPSWELLLAGGWRAIIAALAVGLLEESAKLAGCLAAAADPPRRHVGDSLRTVGAVSAAFATVEAIIVLRGEPLSMALPRAAFGPIAHAILACPLAVALRPEPGRFMPRLRPLIAALLTVSVAHGLADWALARAKWGPYLYVAILLAPTLWLFVFTRRLVGWGMPWDRQPKVWQKGHE